MPREGSVSAGTFQSPPMRLDLRPVLHEPPCASSSWSPHQRHPVASWASSVPCSPCHRRVRLARPQPQRPGRPDPSPRPVSMGLVRVRQETRRPSCRWNGLASCGLSAADPSSRSGSPGETAAAAPVGTTGRFRHWTAAPARPSMAVSPLPEDGGPSLHRTGRGQQHARIWKEYCEKRFFTL